MIKKCLKLNLQSLISFLQTKMADAEAQVSKSLWFLSLGFLVVIFKRFASGNCCNILIANKINVEPQNKIHLSSDIQFSFASSVYLIIIKYIFPSFQRDKMEEYLNACVEKEKKLKMANAAAKLEVSETAKLTIFLLNS